MHPADIPLPQLATRISHPELVLSKFFTVSLKQRVLIAPSRVTFVSDRISRINDCSLFLYIYIILVQFVTIGGQH